MLLDDNRIINSHEYYDELSSMPPEERYLFGIPCVDAITEGFGHGNLIVVSGYTGHGKTSFCQTISYNLWQKGIMTMWFSFEISPRQFFNKYNGKEIPSFCMPKKMKPYDLPWLRKMIEGGKKDFGAKVIFIDHLHYIVPMISGEVRKHELIGDTMRELKQIATKNDVVIFLMAHTKQPKDNLSPTLGDLRDSSFVAQESDAVYVIHRPAKRGRHDEYEDHNIFTIVKQRDNGIIGKNVKLEMHNKMFYDPSALNSERAL